MGECGCRSSSRVGRSSAAERGSRSATRSAGGSLSPTRTLGAVVDAEQLVELSVDAHRPAPTPSKPCGSPVVLTVSGLTLYCSAPNDHAGWLVVRGMVLEDHHALVPEDGVRTAGVVRRIQLATQSSALAAGPQSRTERTYRDVGACPRSFRSTRDGAGLRPRSAFWSTWRSRRLTRQARLAADARYRLPCCGREPSTV